jgi:hypothetical protein
MAVFFKALAQAGTEVYICNPSAWKAEAGGFRVRGQLRLHRKMLSQK